MFGDLGKHSTSAQTRNILVNSDKLECLVGLDFNFLCRGERFFFEKHALRQTIHDFGMSDFSLRAASAVAAFENNQRGNHELLSNNCVLNDIVIYTDTRQSIVEDVLQEIAEINRALSYPLPVHVAFAPMMKPVKKIMRTSFAIQTNDVTFQTFEEKLRSLLQDKFSDPAVQTQFPDMHDVGSVPLSMYLNDSVGGLQRLQDGDWDESFQDAHEQPLSKTRAFNVTVYWDIPKPSKSEAITFKVLSQVCRNEDSEPILLSNSKNPEVMGAFTLALPDKPESGFLSKLYTNIVAVYQTKRKQPVQLAPIFVRLG